MDGKAGERRAKKVQEEERYGGDKKKKKEYKRDNLSSDLKVKK